MKCLSVNTAKCSFLAQLLDHLQMYTQFGLLPVCIKGIAQSYSKDTDYWCNAVERRTKYIYGV